MASNFNSSVRDLVLPENLLSLADWITEFGKAVRTENWRPFFSKTETIIAGNAARLLQQWHWSSVMLTGTALGIIGFCLLLMAVTGALIDESLIEKVNKFLVF